MIVLLDASVVWRLASPRRSAENDRCRDWVTDVLARGARLRVPEIADYEVRRETLRSANEAALRGLDDLVDRLGYVAITTTAMRLAASFWARARLGGSPSADERDLDADVILAAQAVVASSYGEPTIVATENRRHLVAFATAVHWREITLS